jgi:hypothetical protein
MLSELRDLVLIPRLSNEGSTLLHEETVLLRQNLQTWRENPAYAELFHTIFLQDNLIYTCNKAVALLCTYAAMMILINCTLLLLPDSETRLYRLQNVKLAKQICQSYEYSREHSPVGSLAMDFAFRVAYLVPDARQREWIVEKMDEMASPLGGSRDTDVKIAELERCFHYLRY